jgi:small subunit ribosomal protein S19
MARSIWKGPFVEGYVLKKAEKVRESGKNEVIKIWSRKSTILPQFVGLTFGVYNGKKHIPVLISEEMIGQKFGEYSPTRTYYGHAADKKSKEKLVKCQINLPIIMMKKWKQLQKQEIRVKMKLLRYGHVNLQYFPSLWD